MIQKAIFTATYILLAYGLSLLLKHTVGEKWNNMGDTIVHGAFIVVSVLAALEFIFVNALHLYTIVRKELRNANSRNDDNGNN